MKKLGVVLLVAALISCPFWVQFFITGAGTDNRAVDIVSQIEPSYRPWCSNFGLNLGSTAEPFLFALQIAVGLALMAVFFSMLKKRKLHEKNKLHEVKIHEVE